MVKRKQKKIYTKHYLVYYNKYIYFFIIKLKLKEFKNKYIYIL